MNEGKKLEYPEKTPRDKLQRMPHTKAENSSLNQDLNQHSRIGGRRLLEKQMC